MVSDRARSLFAGVATLAFAAVPTACGGGKYGHAVTYAPTSAEETALAGAEPYDPVMAQRREVWHAKRVHLFGVVRSRGAGASGTAALTVGVRRLESRNLCSRKEDEDTCRVTVSEQDFGVVHVVAKLEGEDDVGRDAVAPGSLVRVVGAIGEDVDRDDGAPVVRATFLRHFPRGAYVTRASAEVMRQ